MKWFFNLRGYFVKQMFLSKYRLFFTVVVAVFDFILDICDRIKYRELFRETKKILKQ